MVILDEAHNIEKICENAASIQIKSSDIALAIEEVTAVMKMIADESLNFEDSPKDFVKQELIFLKQMFLDLENELDIMQVGSEGQTFDGTFIFDLLGKVGVSVTCIKYFRIYIL